MLPSLEKMRWSIGISVVACMLLLPSLSWADSAEDSACTSCRVYEVYCQAEDGSVGIDHFCPDLPVGHSVAGEDLVRPGTDAAEPIACQFAGWGTRVPGFCQWNFVGSGASRSCARVDSTYNYVRCETELSDGEVGRGLCVEDVGELCEEQSVMANESYGGNTSNGYQRSDGRYGGSCTCNALGVGNPWFYLLLLGWGLYRRRRG